MLFLRLKTEKFREHVSLQWKAGKDKGDDMLRLPTPSTKGLQIQHGVLMQNNEVVDISLMLSPSRIQNVLLFLPQSLEY